jgi:putative two-component system response regulator
MVHRLARVVEHRDSDTGEHVGRMSGYCALVAQHLGWSHHACEALRLASTMHDIGKVGVPDAILLKRGPLDPGERAIMETHAQVGHDMLADSRSPVVQLAARIALSHHERFDGTGYPQRIAGDAIPLEGRIVAVADVFDALTSDRVYRPAMATDEALAIVEAGRGTHFDPQVVDAFFAALPSILALLDESAEATAAAPVVRVGDAPLAVA